MKDKLRELLELPEWFTDYGGKYDADLGSFDEGAIHAFNLCANQLQSALESADLQGLVDRVEAQQWQPIGTSITDDESTWPENWQFTIMREKDHRMPIFVTWTTADRIRPEIQRWIGWTWWSADQFKPQEQNDE